MLWTLALAGSLFGCGAEDEEDFVEDFRTNSKSVDEVTTLPGKVLDLEVVVNEDEYAQVLYQWTTTQPGGKIDTLDSPFAKMRIGQMLGTYRAECYVTAIDFAGKVSKQTVGVEFEVVKLDEEVVRKVLLGILIDGLDRANGGLTNFAAGQAVEVLIREEAGMTDLDVDVAVSEGGLSALGPTRYLWLLPDAKGVDAKIDLDVTGVIDGVESYESYSHTFRTE